MINKLKNLKIILKFINEIGVDDFLRIYFTGVQVLQDKWNTPGSKVDPRMLNFKGEAKENTIEDYKDQIDKLYKELNYYKKHWKKNLLGNFFSQLVILSCITYWWYCSGYTEGYTEGTEHLISTLKTDLYNYLQEILKEKKTMEPEEFYKKHENFLPEFIDFIIDFVWIVKNTLEILF